MSIILPTEFYRRSDVLIIARELLGCYLVSDVDGHRTAGRIVETEAYDGLREAATQRHLIRRRQQSKLLFALGGLAYVYTVYRIHRLFNIVTGNEAQPAAVLIRAVEPVEGAQMMRMRRPKGLLTAGPGMLTQALAIGTHHYGHDLTRGQGIWLEDRGTPVTETEVATGPRIGIDYAGADAALPWRFCVRHNRWVSRPRL